MTGYSLTERLAQHLLRPVDTATRARARLHLLDWLGCVAGALRGPRRWTLAPTRGIDLTATLGSLMEMDDVHRAAILHPGPVVWPAALGQRGTEPAPLGAVLDAGVRGYEAMIGVGATFDAHHYAFHHNTATAGAFGAAAAAWDGDAAMLADMFGLAGSVSAGLWQLRHEDSDAKAFHALNAVAIGTQARRLVRLGMRGPRHILEGPQGLYAATCRAPRPDRLTGDGWRIAEVSFKPWAACRHAHPVIDAVLELRAAGASPDAAMRIETYRDALLFCDRAQPTTVAEAKFSLQHAAAVAMLAGEPEPRHFALDAIGNDAWRAYRAGIVVAESAEFTDRYPDHFGARVTVGADSVTLVDTRGDPERPMTAAAIEAKARALMAWGGVAADADAAVAFALAADDAASVAPLATMLIDWLDR